MAAPIEEDVTIHTIETIPGVLIWYCSNSDIVTRMFRIPCAPDFRAMRSRIFDRSSFSRTFLHPDELADINGFKTLKKQVERICSRFLIKQLLRHTLQLENTPYPDITIAYEDQGAPYLPGHESRSISLSHSNDLTAGAISLNDRTRIGLDIECIEKMPDEYFLKTAFTARECDTLVREAPSIYRQWTIKEAYLKFIKKGFNESLHQVEIVNDRIYHHGGPADVRIHSWRISSSIENSPEYAVSLVTGDAPTTDSS